MNNLKTEIKTFMTNRSNTKESEKVPIIMNWLGCEGLRFGQTLTVKVTDKIKTIDNLSEKIQALA